jgi:hypothetical protein
LKIDKVSTVVLLSSAGLFAISLLYFLFSLLPKDLADDASQESLSSKLISEYVYYDISDSSAKLFINFDNTGLNPAAVEIKCGENGAELINISLSGEEDVYHINNLQLNTRYECYFTLNYESGNKTLYDLGYFNTINTLNLVVNDAKFDAYDVGFNVVFRASWSGDAEQYLVTKTKLSGEDILLQSEAIVSRNNYLDTKVGVNSRYQYEIRALNSGKLGQPVFINVLVPAGERFEDVPAETVGVSLRILVEDVRIKTAGLEEIQLEDINNIAASDYTHFIVNESGLLILINDLSNSSGFIYAGSLDGNRFKAESIYVIEDLTDDIIFNASLNDKVLSLDGSGNIMKVRYYNPSGELLESILNNGTARLEMSYDYIYLKTQQGLVKVSQKYNASQIAYSAETRRVSWDNINSFNKYNSYLLKISSNRGEPIFAVLLDNPSYILDQEIAEESLMIEILGYAREGLVLLGSKQIDNIQRTLIRVNKLEMEKIGTSLSLNWDANSNYSYIIEISQRGSSRWQTIRETKPGENSYLLRNVTDLNQGRYDIRISPKNSNMVGSPTVAECHIRVSNLKDYQILCE